MRRRSLLRALPVAALGVGTAGCSSLGIGGRPEVRMDSGHATLHPAEQLYVANGLQPDGDDSVFVTAVADEAPERIGPAAEGTFADTLRNPGTDQFHVVVQLRSAPHAPMELWPAPGNDFTWPDSSTLRATVEVEPWSPLDDPEDEELREADELVYSGIWSLTPAVDPVPENVELELAARTL